MASMTSTSQAEHTGSGVPVEYFPHLTEQPSLPRVLGIRDLTIFSLLTVVTLGSISSIGSGGPVTLLYSLLGFILFQIPRIIIVLWLSKQIREGETLFSRLLTKGRELAFATTFCIWLSGILIIATATKIHIEIVHSIELFLSVNNPSQLIEGCVISALLLVTILIACIPMRVLKYVLLGLAIPYLSIFLLLGCIGIWWLLSGHTPAYAFTSPQQWSLNANNVAVFGVIASSLLGIPIPIILEQELKISKFTRSSTISRFLWVSSISACAIQIYGALGVMVIVPQAPDVALTAPVTAIAMVFGSTARLIMLNILSLGQVTVIIAALVLYSRLLVVLAQEKILPRQLAYVNRQGVPIISTIVQGVVGVTFSILIFIVTPYLIGQLSEPVKHVLGIKNDFYLDLYTAIKYAVAVLFIVTSAGIFLLGMKLLLLQSRRKQDIQLQQRAMLSVVSLIGLGASLYATWLIFTNYRLINHFSKISWPVLLLCVIVGAVLFGLLITTLPRVQASLQEQLRLNAQEADLRSQLQESYEQQRVLLEEVNILYHEHAQAAITDAITGLPNHRALMSKIDDMLAECRLTQQPCAILFTDLDHFKRVNDTWGHRAGDAILCEVGKRFRTTLRTQDLVGRYGGEEFAILLTDTDIEEASQVAERLRVAVNSEPCIWQEDGQAPLPIPVTTSIGVAVYSLHGTTRELLIISADQAMYRAKKTGRNRVCIADLEQDTMDQQKLPSSDRTISETEAIQALTAAASAHDGGTHDHSHRLVQLAEETARVLGRSEDEVHLIRLAALLHDIGKIGIPDAILHKPGPLSSDEWAIMRSHPEIGRTILEQTGGILRLLSNIVVAHHERWDGTGYPAQLRGDNIPLGARILSVVDSYDAMISRRAYREPRSIEEAKAELQHCAGSQFDPQVVNAFFLVLEQKQELLISDTV